MPTAPEGSEARAVLLFILIRKDLEVLSSFNTISTFLPSGVRKATLGKLSSQVDPMRTDPGGIDLEACATIYSMKHFLLLYPRL